MRGRNHGVDEQLIEAEEDLVIDAQFLLQEMMNEQRINRAELARRAGISKARLTQLLRSEANPTLRTLAGLFHACGDALALSRKSAQRATFTVPADLGWCFAWDSSAEG